MPYSPVKCGGLRPLQATGHRMKSTLLYFMAAGLLLLAVNAAAILSGVIGTAP